MTKAETAADIVTEILKSARVVMSPQEVTDFARQHHLAPQLAEIVVPPDAR